MKKLITMLLIIIFLFVNLVVAENHDQDYVDDYKQDYREYNNRGSMMRDTMMRNYQLGRNELRDFREMPFRDDMPLDRQFDQQPDRASWFEMQKSREKEHWGEKQQQIEQLRQRNPWMSSDRDNRQFEDMDKMMEERNFDQFSDFNTAINPRKDIREIMMKELKTAVSDEQQCNNPEQLVERLYAQLTEEISELKTSCNKMDEMMGTCRERMTEMCEQRSQGFNRGMDPMMSQCPPDKEKMIQLCLKGSAQEGDQRCEQEWEINQDQIKYTCEGSQECDEDRFMRSCMNNNGFNGFERHSREEERRDDFGQREERYEERDDTRRDVEEREQETTPENLQREDLQQDKMVETLTAVTGDVIYENEGMKDSCQQRWNGEKERCGEQKAHCSKQSYLELCMKRANPGMDNPDEIRRYHCERYAQGQMPMMMRFCAMKSEINRGCNEQAEQTCKQMSQQAQQCQEQFSEKELKIMLKRAIDYNCKLKTADIEELPEGSDVYSVKQMMELMRQEFPDDQEDELETEMTGLLTVIDEGKELEQAEENKPLWYKFRRFFGFLEEQEKQREVSALSEIQENIGDLQERIEDLTAIMQELDSKATQERLQIQIDKLGQQKQRLEKQADKLAKLFKEV